MVTGLKNVRLVSVLILFVLGTLSIGCSGSGGSSSTTSVVSGSVSLALQDAPVEDLRNFNIDVTEIILRGESTAGVDTTFQVFPGEGSPTGAVLDLDLLSLQGFNQLLGNADVPVGTYHSLRISFENPRATSEAGVDQTITVGDDQIVVSLTPPMTIAEDSAQSIQIDFDLAGSVIDLGNDEILLAPAVDCDVTREALPVKRFPALITALDADSGSFEAEVIFPGADAPEAGIITVQTSSETQVGDGQGNTTQGNVFDVLVVDDFVKISGQLSNGVLSAEIIRRVPGTTAGGGLPTNGVAPGVELSGTIVSKTASTVTVNVDFIEGSSTAVDLFTDVELTVDATSALQRGGTQILIDDLTVGNYALAFASQSGSTFNILELESIPSYIAGIVTNVQSGTGENGKDKVFFTPDTINQLDASDIAAVPASLNLDVKSGYDTETGNIFECFAFFTQAAGGNANQLKTLNFGGIAGALPPPENDAVEGFLAGTVAAAPAPTLNGSGGIDFTLNPEVAATVAISVVVDSAAQIAFFDDTGDVTSMSVNEAVTALTDGPGRVEVLGAPGGQGIFNASEGLFIFESANLEFNFDETELAIGTVAVAPAPVLNGNGAVEFDLVLGDFGGPAGTLSVTIPTSAFVEEIDENGTPTELTLVQAVTALAATPDFVEVEGTSPPSGGAFNANLGVRIFSFPDGLYPAANSVIIAGEVLADVDVVVNAAGDLEFSIFDFNTGNDLAVTLDKDANKLLFDDEGEVKELSLSNVKKTLTSDPFFVELEGSAPPTATSFDADLSIRLFGNPSQPEDQTFGNLLGGEVLAGTTPSVDGSGDVTFTLEYFGPGGGIFDVVVTADQNGELELFDDSGVSDLTPAQAVAALTDDETVFVEVSGAMQYTGGTTYAADLALRIFQSTDTNFIPEGTFIGGQVDDDEAAVENAAGDVTFLLKGFGPSGVEKTFSVTIPSGTDINVFNDDGTGDQLGITAAQAVIELNNEPSFVDLFGSGMVGPAPDNAFVADGDVAIFTGFATEPDFHVLSGNVESSTTPAINANGNIAFVLEAPGATGAPTTISVIVDADAELERIDEFGFVSNLSVNAAVNNLTGFDGFVQLEGSSAPTANGFTADHALRLFEAPEVSNFVFGIVQPGSTPTIDTSNNIEVIIDSDEGSGIISYTVTIPATTVVTLFKDDGEVKTIEPEDALEELSDSPSFVDMGGSAAPAGTTFTADIFVNIFEDGGAGGGSGSGGAYLSGNISAGSSAAASGNDIVFTMDIFSFGGPGGQAEVTVTDEADLFLVDEFGAVSAVSMTDAIDALNDGPFNVDVSGTAPFVEGTDDEYEADLELFIFAGVANILFGEPGSTATVDGSGDIVFTLDTYDPSGLPISIDVVVDVSEVDEMVFYDEFGSPETLTTAQGAADAINGLAAGEGEVIVEGTQPPTTGNDFLADIRLEVRAIGAGGGSFIFGNLNPSSTAEINTSTGNIEFSLDTENPMGGGILTVAVEVSPTAFIQLIDAAGAPTTLSAPEAVTEINNNGQAAGIALGSFSSTPPGSTEFYADDFMDIRLDFAAFRYGGAVNLSTTQPSIDGSGNVTFVMDVEYGPQGPISPPEEVTVTVDQNAFFEVNDTSGPVVFGSLTDIVDYLAGDPDTVEVEGISELASGAGTYDVGDTGSLVIFLFDPNPPVAEFEGMMPTGTTASFDDVENEVNLQLEVEHPVGSGSTVTVTVTVDADTAVIEFPDLMVFGAADVVSELNAFADTATVVIAGSTPWDGESTYLADEEMIVFNGGGAGGSDTSWTLNGINDTNQFTHNDGGTPGDPSDDTITFALDTYDTTGAAATVSVTVDAMAMILEDRDIAAGGLQNTYTDLPTMDVFLQTLAASTYQVEVEGHQAAPDFTGATPFVADGSFIIYTGVEQPVGNFISGTIASTAMDSSGNVVFDVEIYNFTLEGVTVGTTVTVTLDPANAVSYFHPLGGAPVQLNTLQDIIDALNGTNPIPFRVRVLGTYDLGTSTLDATTTTPVSTLDIIE